MKIPQQVTTLLKIIFLLALTHKHSFAGDAEIIEVQHQCSKDYICSFSTTLKHTDTGWDHYANQWEVLSENGDILGTRTLHHPHVNEQPFTRSLSGIKIPNNAKQVRIRARDSAHGLNKKEFIVKIN